ncbi:hypothetical protein SKAU_G00247810 [Synaphobranchus kaupii]|uniref:Uncharacterized protein n=1 Tax=Synaphobranchus kaupii TaxID=118154 RepID=A0A9Q1F2C3_SYNKA|nr:hypothetical protein SKAU_G00247810 [Synaphobranchus kaupii]
MGKKSNGAERTVRSQKRTEQQTGHQKKNKCSRLSEEYAVAVEFQRTQRRGSCGHKGKRPRARGRNGKMIQACGYALLFSSPRPCPLGLIYARCRLSHTRAHTARTSSHRSRDHPPSLGRSAHLAPQTQPVSPPETSARHCHQDERASIFNSKASATHSPCRS